jgi:hypothetical protein
MGFFIGIQAKDIFIGFMLGSLIMALVLVISIPFAMVDIIY